MLKYLGYDICIGSGCLDIYLILREARALDLGRGTIIGAAKTHYRISRVDFLLLLRVLRRLIDLD